MGQYFIPVNLDKKEYLNAHLFDCGLKLTETCYVGNGYIDALTYLLESGSLTFAVEGSAQDVPPTL